MLKGGLYHATKITTVSPTYAAEVQTPDGGCGLNALLRFRASDLIGVLNGVDLDDWNPETDPLIPQPFSADNMQGKAAAKAALQKAYGLAVNPSVPLFTVVSRLANQKGLDLLAAIADRLMADMHIQVAVLGTGEPTLEHAFHGLTARYPGRFGSYIGFNNELAHLTIAGADCFLMPSRFEPCGLSQLYAFRYGAIPVVRATGGLVDTVVDTTPATLAAGPASGFVFRDFDSRGLEHALGRALNAHADVATWQQLVTSVMQQDWSWDASARKYLELYEQIRSRPPAPPPEPAA